MSPQEKRDWMAIWCAQNNCQLQLAGEVGFGRDCVGILTDGNYPEYDEGVWAPEGAYHKHDCVAVLGRGDDAEAKLFAWLKWFDEHGYSVSSGFKPDAEIRSMHPIQMMMGQHKSVRMTKENA